ncbi:hypothetical protein ACFPVT_06115 [Corynebacterium choanae]|uniref:hypothetical protein n=1 Tax=Corynebacterium choanae TaxID=1862358 RepID=UPI001FEC0116|nr:hypothetical protein [Corynebacterium choanae]
MAGVLAAGMSARVVVRTVDHLDGGDYHDDWSSAHHWTALHGAAAGDGRLMQPGYGNRVFQLAADGVRHDRYAAQSMFAPTGGEVFR